MNDEVDVVIDSEFKTKDLNGKLEASVRSLFQGLVNSYLTAAGLKGVESLPTDPDDRQDEKR